MSRYESSVKTIGAPQQSIYDRLADLSQLQTLKDNLTDEQRQAIRQKIEEAGKGQIRLSDFQFTADTASCSVMGMPLVVRIVDREPWKTIKYTTDNSPIAFTLWVQLKSTDPYLTKVRVTIDIDIPFYLKPLVGSKLDSAADQVADMLTRIPY